MSYFHALILLLLEDTNNKSYSSTKNVVKVINFLNLYILLFLTKKLFPLIILNSFRILGGVGILSFCLLLIF